MKNIYLSVFFLAFSSLFLQAQEDDDLLALLGEDEPITDYTIANKAIVSEIYPPFLDITKPVFLSKIAKS